MPHKPLARQAGKFVKHVLPAAVKPVHSLWHEVIGFIFIAFAALLTWKVIRTHMGPVQLAIIIPLILITVGYGVSSFLKARRISRS